GRGGRGECPHGRGGSDRRGGGERPAALHKGLVRAAGRVACRRRPYERSPKVSVPAARSRGTPVMKKPIVRTLGVFVAVGLVFLAVAECRPGAATAFNFWRVGVGMSQAEVESLLGPGTGLRPGEPAGITGQTERLIVPGQPAADVDYTLRWVANDFSGKYL